VGAYSLGAVYDELKDGTKNDTWGAGVKGSLVFTPSGQFTVQIVSADRDKTASKSPRTPIGPIVTYFGTYTTDDASKTITYHIERSSFPGWDNFDRKIVVGATGSTLKLVSTVTGDPKLGDFKSYQEWQRN